MLQQGCRSAAVILLFRQIESISLPQFAGKFFKIDLGHPQPTARKRIADNYSIRRDFFDEYIVVDYATDGHKLVGRLHICRWT